MNNRFTSFIKNRAYSHKNTAKKTREFSLSHEQIATLVHEKISSEKKMSVKELCIYMKNNHDISRSFHWRSFLKSLDFVAMRHGKITFRTPDGVYEELFNEIPQKVEFAAPEMKDAAITLNDVSQYLPNGKII